MRNTIAAVWALGAYMLMAHGIAASEMNIGPSVAVAPPAPDGQAHLRPATASDGVKTFLVAWQQGQKFFEGPDSTIYAARVGLDGKVLDAKPLAMGAGKGSMERPRVAFANGVFLVVWQDFRNGKDWDVYGARVKPDGTVLDAQPIKIAVSPQDQALPDVAGGPQNFLVTWQDRRNGKHYEIFGARVSTDGKVVDAGGVPLGDGKRVFRGGQAVATAINNGWFVAWFDPFQYRSGGESHPYFYARLADGGANLRVVKNGQIANGLYNHYFGCITGSGNRVLYANGGQKRSKVMAFAVVYNTDTCEPLANPNADPAKSGASGWNVKNALPLLMPLVPGFSPPMAAGASNDLFLVCVRQNGGTKKQPNSPLRLVRVDHKAKRLDPNDALPILNDGQVPCSNPAVAGVPGGHFLVAYESDAGPGKQQVLVHIVKSNP